MVDSELLTQEIEASGMKVQAIAEKIGLTPAGFYNKLGGKSEFKVSEVIKLCKILHLSHEKRDAIFFAPNVA